MHRLVDYDSSNSDTEVDHAIQDHALAKKRKNYLEPDSEDEHDPGEPVTKRLRTFETQPNPGDNWLPPPFPDDSDEASR